MKKPASNIESVTAAIVEAKINITKLHTAEGFVQCDKLIDALGPQYANYKFGTARSETETGSANQKEIDAALMGLCSVVPEVIQIPQSRQQGSRWVATQRAPVRLSAHMIEKVLAEQEKSAAEAKPANPAEPPPETKRGWQQAKNMMRAASGSSPPVVSSRTLEKRAAGLSIDEQVEERYNAMRKFDKEVDMTVESKGPVNLRSSVAIFVGGREKPDVTIVSANANNARITDVDKKFSIDFQTEKGAENIVQITANFRGKKTPEAHLSGLLAEFATSKRLQADSVVIRADDTGMVASKIEANDPKLAVVQEIGAALKK